MTKWMWTVWVTGAMVLMLLPPDAVIAQTIPDGAIEEGRRLFNMYMVRAQEDPEEFRRIFEISDSGIECTNAVLEDPYVIFTIGTAALGDLGRSSNADFVSRLVKSVTPTSYVFPLTIEGRYLCAIKVGENKDLKGNKLDHEGGNYVLYGIHLADDYMEERILELRGEYPITSGYFVSCLIIHRLGGYFLIRSEKGGDLTTPYTLVSGNVLSVEEGVKKGRFPVIPMNEAVPKLKAKAQEIEIERTGSSTESDR